MDDIIPAPQNQPVYYPPNTPYPTHYWDGWTWQPVVVQAAYPQWSYTQAPKPTNHTFHLLMSLLTAGMWLPVWAIMTVINKSSHQHSTTYYGPR